MSAPIIVVGHKNPDNDSISSAVGYAYLKKRGRRDVRKALRESPAVRADQVGLADPSLGQDRPHAAGMVLRSFP